MALCDMCGRTGRLVSTKLEGSVLSVCEVCSKYGERVVKPKGFIVRKRSFSHPDDNCKVVSNVSRLLQSEQNKLGMDLNKFSALLNEKVSSVQKWQSGSLNLSLSEARKVGKILGISLVKKSFESTELNVAAGNSSKGSGEGLTLGDFIKVRKRK